MLQDKPKIVYKIKERVIEDFERKYSEACNQKMMRKKNRGVSKDSPFFEGNKPPIEHI
jgi:hypothetical protein